MSWTPAAEPTCAENPELPSGLADPVELLIEARARDLGGFSVRRILPVAARRMVGPFIFFDHMGPVAFAPGQGMDVRPHPHIDLATVTYLFEGEIVHRDSVGSLQPIRPGEINWMTAGRGIAHSERTGPELRAAGSRLHGIQLWVALPRAHEDDPPSFHHHAGDTLPAWDDGGAHLRLLAGAAWGREAPVRTLSPLFYADATLAPGTTLRVPTEHPERAAYVVSGAIDCCGRPFTEGQMLVLRAGADAPLRAEGGQARVMLLGGAPLDGPRHIWWNFVSSSKERIERAKADWKAGRFAKVTGDEHESIPLPE